MKSPKQQPQYKLKPIRSLPKLSVALGIPEIHLSHLAEKADALYRKAKPIVKPDGSIRQPFDAFPPLKQVQRLIKDRLLKRVNFPEYLTGSLKGRDYRINAKMHASSKVVICEDIKSFFPSTGHKQVKDVWLRFFGFSEDVANLLTLLTTMKGKLPQGAVTSSYLANLMFWDSEPDLREQFSLNEIVYSRFVDDITVSSKRTLSKYEQTEIIAQIYGMLKRHGYRANRHKHEVSTSGRRMLTTKLVVNRKPALPPQERQNIRAAVYALEQRVIFGERGPEITTELNRVTSRVGRLGSLHATEAGPLKLRIRSVREIIRILQCGLPVNSTDRHEEAKTLYKEAALLRD